MYMYNHFHCDITFSKWIALHRCAHNHEDKVSLFLNLNSTHMYTYIVVVVTSLIGVHKMNSSAPKLGLLQLSVVGPHH